MKFYSTLSVLVLILGCDHQPENRETQDRPSKQTTSSFALAAKDDAVSACLTFNGLANFGDVTFITKAEATDLHKCHDPYSADTIEEGESLQHPQCPAILEWTFEARDYLACCAIADPYSAVARCAAESPRSADCEKLITSCDVREYLY